MARYITQRGKTDRAFRAYVDLMDAADRLREEVGGRRIVRVRLTPEGERVIAYIYPWLAKLVKAEMRVLDGREQRTLSRLCQKVREGNAVKLVKELLKVDAEEEES